METRDIRLTQIDEDNWVQKELFGGLLPLLRKYFLSGEVHGEFFEGPFSINIYGKPHPSFFELCQKCPASRDREQKFWHDLRFPYPRERKGFSTKYCWELLYYYKNPSPPEEFFYWKDPPPSSGFCVTIYVNDRLVGQFCPRYQVLHTSAWTYNQQCIAFAQSLFPRLVQGLKLKEAQIPERISFPNARIILGCAPSFEQLDWPNVYSPIPAFLEEDVYTTGLRGYRGCVELCPEPSSHPRYLARNVARLMEQIDIPLSVKGDRFPISGPLHFRIPFEARMRGIVASLTAILDDFLGTCFLPLAGTAGEHIGQLGQYKLQPWGFEYGALPTAYYADRRATEIVYKIARNVVEAALHQGKLSYTVPPTREDYKRIARLTDEEYDYLFVFIKQYPLIYSGTAINAQWRKRPLVLFRGTWAYWVQEYIHKQLRAIRQPAIVVLYGLNYKYDQAFAGITIPGYLTFYHPFSPADNEIIAVGAPFGFRTGAADRKTIDLVCAAIGKEIGERAKRRERLVVMADAACFPGNLFNKGQ